MNNENFNQNNELSSTEQKVSKKIFLIPLILFLCYLIPNIFIFTADRYDSNYMIVLRKLRSIGNLCLVLFVPALIITIIIYNSKKIKKVNVSTLASSNESLDEKLLKAYVNQNYEKITTSKFNFCALFFNLAYLIYRKAYKYAAIFAGIFTVMIILHLPEELYTFIILIMAVILGFKFNSKYIEDAKIKIQKLKNESQGESEESLINKANKIGGTDIWKLIIIYIILMVIGTLITQSIFNNLP